MKNFQHLVELIEFLERKYCLNICIKDYIGFIPINKCLDTALAPYLAHSNPYCLFVKQDRKRWFKCLSMIRPMYNKCIASNDGFFGICHAGIYEYVLPIKLDGKVLGSINIGHFPGKEKESARLIQRLFHENGTAMLERACQSFTENIIASQISTEEIIPQFSLISEYLSQTYAVFKSLNSKEGDYLMPKESAEDYMISLSIDYISHNYDKKISVKQLAHEFHYSESFFNHCFTRKTGVSFSTYVNKVRIEHAKQDMLTGSDSIATIAYNVGFSDPNYFSRVCTKLLGITPSEFRRRYTT
ncbi:MAG: helix-turn-helix domain-containing protein [Flexilinea sp.]